MTFKTVFMILICVVLFEMFPWPIDMIVAFILISKHTQNFVIKPLARYLSINGRTPENYMFRKLKNIREVIWFFAIFLELDIIFIFELLAIGISCKIINNIKNKMGIPTSVFSKDDYTIYDEYLRYSEDNPPLVEDAFYEDLDDDYKIVKEISYTRPIDNESVKTNIEREYVNKAFKDEDVIDEQVNLFKQKIEEKIEKFDDNVEETIVDALEESIEEIEEKFEKEINIPEVNMDFFNKPVEDIKTDFSVKPTTIETTSKFDFDKPIGDISTSSNTSTIVTSGFDLKDDEITCEKCGTVMSKNKIACPKCGTLVKYKPKR